MVADGVARNVDRRHDVHASDRAIAARVRHCGEVRLGPYLALIAESVFGFDAAGGGQREAAHAPLLAARTVARTEISSYGNVAELRFRDWLNSHLDRRWDG